MDAETLSRAFEPFFTTKGPTQGSGLGLAQVDGTMRQAGGFVEADSTLGVGTTIRLAFPVPPS
jgi:signal transduction histidine kinase